MIELVFLGTGGSIPTMGRNHPSVALKYQGYVLVFDAGEDVQRQFEAARIGLNKPMAIFITHQHGDHILGLGGLLLRLSLLGRIKPLSIYGPKALIDYVKMNQETINLGTTFPTTVYGIEESIVFSEEYASVRSFQVDHRGFALGYEFTYQRPTGQFLPEKAKELGVPKGPLWKSLASGNTVELEDGTQVEPGDVTSGKPKTLKIVYSGDTRPCQAVRDAAKDADILIHEAMYTMEHADLASERGHSTASDAAEIARDCCVKLLLLTHYSPRYGDGTEILNEARNVFSNAHLARDLLRIKLSLDGSIELNQSE
ncbi:MAG: ribonuclease Z [Candidatus Thorarchaeota archaeon]|jgi:ribonuclease Z